MATKKESFEANIIPLSQYELEILKTTVLAGYTQNATQIDEGLINTNGRIRSAAIRAAVRAQMISDAKLESFLTDQSAEVRITVVNASITRPGIKIHERLHLEEEPLVYEALIFTLGERKERSSHDELCRIALSHSDALCREAAVAALANLEMEASLDTLIQAANDRPPIRRRVAIALAYFDNPVATQCLERLAKDRDWQTRKIANDLLDIERGEGSYESNQEVDT